MVSRWKDRSDRLVRVNRLETRFGKGRKRQESADRSYEALPLGAPSESFWIGFENTIAAYAAIIIPITKRIPADIQEQGASAADIRNAVDTIINTSNGCRL